jgi:hypothetical protein
MPVRRLARALYARASETTALRRPLDTVRRSPRVRRFARRHVGVLLSRGTTWANVDGALRLLAEDPDQPILFGPWTGDAATEILYWAPFVRWAGDHFSLDPHRVGVLSRHGTGEWYGEGHSVFAQAIDAARRDLPGAIVFRPEPVRSLFETYRRGDAALRPLLKRTRYTLIPPPSDLPVEGLRLPEEYVAIALSATPAWPATGENEDVTGPLLEALSTSRPIVWLDQASSPRAQHALLAGATGLVAAYSGLTLLAGMAGIPVIALRLAESEVTEFDLDLAQRVVAGLGGSLTILDPRDFEALQAPLGEGPFS